MPQDHAALRDVLAATDFFADADDRTLEALAAAGSVRQLVRGDVLFETGDPPDSLYVVTRGRIAIAIANPIDRRESVVALMEPGDLFGELGMLDDQPRSAMARALEPSAVLAVPFTPVLTMFDEQPRLLWNVTRLLAQRLRAMDEALADSVFLDVTGRTAKRLLELADGSDQFMLPVTQEELAGMVGASRERVNKAIASFIRLGWLEQRDRQYRITQRDASSCELATAPAVTHAAGAWCRRCRSIRVLDAIGVSGCADAERRTLGCRAHALESIDALPAR